MNIRKIIRFLFPEYQIIETIKKHGFVAKERNKNNYTMHQYQTSHDTPVKDKVNIEGNTKRQFGKEKLNKNTIMNKNELEYRNTNFNNRLEVNEQFHRAFNFLSNKIIGQEAFIKNLVLAFKRPFVMGYDGEKPKNTIFIIGPEGSGRHKIVETAISSLQNEKLIGSKYISKVDLSLYPTVSEKHLFLSDLYNALYCNSDIIIFDSFEKCHNSFISILSSLVEEGKYMLNARYAIQNDSLVEATGMLLRDSISQISAKGKYFVFITDKSKSKIIDVFGKKFISSVGDILELAPYTEEELKAYTKGFLKELEQTLRENLSIILKYDEDLLNHCVSQYSQTIGLKGIKEYINEDIYKPMAEYKLKENIKDNSTVELLVFEEKLMASILKGNSHDLIDLSLVLPQVDTDNLDEIKRELDSIIGLKKVKEYILDLENNLKIQKIRQSRGYKTPFISMNMIFTGNPGTGKTTIARIIAKYLKAVGVLSTGQLREVGRADLVGQYVGHTAKQTNEVIQSALGGVLFIDEAYSLCRDKHDTFGLEAIDALVKAMEDNKDNLVVILAGYKEEMEEFLNTNTGLKSRFPNIIEFEDYTPEEMYDIALVTAKSKGYRIDDNCKKPLTDLFERNQIKGRNDSGNGRLVRNIIESAILEQSKRLIKDNDAEMDLLTLEDFKLYKPKPFDLDKALNDIVGLDEVKSFIRSLYARLRLQREREKLGLPVDNSLTLHMIFKGNPGTGKTMVARTIAQVLYSIGAIKTDKLVETDRAGLVAGYVGQTAIKTREKLMEAMDGVLFIDEAYSLSQGGPNDFGKEAIDTLVKLMDDYRDRIVIILAGYSHDMENFLKVNPGLKSRFPNIIEFRDYKADELMEIAEVFYKNKGYVLRDSAKAKLKSILEDASKEEAFGNGRYVRNIFERSVNNQALRLSNDMDLTREELITIEAEDIERV